MTTKIYTDIPIQATSPKTHAVKRDGAADKTTFADELHKRIDNAGKPEEPQKPSSGKQAEGVTQQEEHHTEEPEQPSEQAAAAAQIVTLFTAVTPLVPTMTDQPSKPTLPAQPSELMAVTPNDVAQPAKTPLQQAVPAELPEIAADDAAPKLEQPALSFQACLSGAAIPDEGTAPVLTATSPQGDEAGAEQQPDAHKQAGSHRTQMASAERTSEQKPPPETKTTPDTGEMNVFAKRLNELGLSFKTEPVAAHVPGEAAPASQVATAVLEAFKNGKTEFTMRLEPEMLGELTVKLVLEQGKLSLSILTATDQTAKLLDGQMSELRTALKANNIQMETCTVENQSFNNLASGGEFSMLGGRQQERPEHSQRILITQLPSAAENTVSQLRVLKAASILNCYV